MTWERVAYNIEDLYGGFVDWDEEFFICPECGEPIYKCDWFENSKNSDEPIGKYYCPVCDEILISDDEDDYGDRFL